MVSVLEKYPAETFAPLYSLLDYFKIPPKGCRNNRRGFPERHRAITFGITKGRFNNTTGLSYWSKKKPEIYAEIMRIGKLICPFEYTSIHLNNNVVCPKHIDGTNVGRSLLVSFGDYTGCNIVVDGIIYDAKYTPIIFDGSILEHWNTDDLVGNKYSLVFFCMPHNLMRHLPLN